MIHAQDIRYALRLLARSPGFALLTVLVLAGGLGLSTFTFSFLYTAMIRPLPLDGGDRIVRLSALENGRGRSVDAVDIGALRGSLETVRDVGAYTERQVLLGRGADSRVFSATVADPGLFVVARTPPRLGRTLLPADAEPGAEPVMVLAYRAWEIAFGADAAAVGSSVTINGVPTRVVGVMPAGFGFPVTQDAWLPLPSTTGRLTPPGTEWVGLFGRLAAGATQEQAAAEATTRLQHVLAARQHAAAELAPVMAVTVESFPAAQLGEGRTLVFAGLNLAAALILLLSLVNVTTLLTARANERIRETAVRLALGASTGRLVMQGMWEGVLLCVAGGVAGTAAAAWGLDAITRWTRANLEGNLAFWWVWHVDRVTLLAAGAFVTVAIATVGAVVSLRAMRTNVRDVIQDTGARAGSRREGRLARVLIVTQVATVTTLMFVGVLGAVMARRVVTIDPGYDPARLLQVGLEPPADRFATDDARARLFVDVQARLAEHGAIEGVLLRTTLGRRDGGGTFEPREGTAGGKATAQVVATLGAISTLGIAVSEGRTLQSADDRAQPPVAVVSRALAARHWPGRSPVGHQLRLTGTEGESWRTIVGVVSDIPYGNPFSRDLSAEAIYVPLLQTAASGAQVVVRHRTSEIAGRQALYEVFGAIDPQLVPGHVFRVEEVIEKSGLITVGLVKLIGACFALALLLAVAGCYGLMSRSIGLRTREIGVRRALGASDAMATRMLLVQGARQLGVGALVAAPVLAVIGVAATRLLPLGAALTSITGVVVSAAIVGVVLAATWVPTRKAMRVPLRNALVRE